MNIRNIIKRFISNEEKIMGRWYYPKDKNNLYRKISSKL